MKWYYAVGTEQQGPVDKEELIRLADKGTIQPSTKVWSEGMNDWEPFSKKFPDNVSSLPGISTSAALSSSGEVPCAHCDQTFPPDEVVPIKGKNVCATCKPIVLQGIREGDEGVTNEEEIRKAHIKHEASIKSVGILYLISGCFLLLAGLFGLTEAGQLTIVEVFLTVGFFLGLGGLSIYTGIAIRRLQPWTRVAVGIFSGIGLLGVPVGTLINGYILWLFFSEKGKRVLAPDYKDIIAATPHVKYKSGGCVAIFVIVIICMIFFGLIGTFVGK